MTNKEKNETETRNTRQEDKTKRIDIKEIEIIRRRNVRNKVILKNPIKLHVPK